MNEPAAWTYLKLVAGTEDGQTIADAAGVTPPQVSRWKSGKNRPDADKLITFARHYQRPPIEALIAGRYIRADEADHVVEVLRGPERITDDELLDEVRERMNGVRRGVEVKAKQVVQGQAGQAQKKSDDPQLSGRDRLRDLTDETIEAMGDDGSLDDTDNPHQQR